MSDMLSEELDERQRALVEQIQERKGELVDKYSTEYSTTLTGIKRYTKLQNKAIVSQMWKNIRQDKKGVSRISEFEKKLNALLNDELWKQVRQLKMQTENFWAENESAFKSEIIRIITGATFLSEYKRRELEKYVFEKKTPSFKRVNLNLDSIGGIKVRKLLFIKIGTIVDIEKCADEYAKKYEDQITGWNGDLVNTNSKRFKKWTDDLIIGIQGLMSRWNPELHDLSAKLEGVEKLKESMVVIGGKLESALQELDILTQFKEGENHDGDNERSGCVES